MSESDEDLHIAIDSDHSSKGQHSLSQDSELGNEELSNSWKDLAAPPNDDPRQSASPPQCSGVPSSFTSTVSDHADTEPAEDSDGENSDSSTGSESGELCAICLSHMKGEIGSPDTSECDHAFCLLCILEWAKNNASCPQDRRPFERILVRSFKGGEVTNTIPVEIQKDEVEVTLDEEITVCEICDSSEHEDRLLLCDGCDLGFHLYCLTPPLLEIPIEEWFCPMCIAVDIPKVVHETSRTEATAASSSSSSSRRQRAEKPRIVRPTRPPRPRMIPRTRATERVLVRIALTRGKKKGKKLKDAEGLDAFEKAFNAPRPFGRLGDDDIDATYNKDEFADKLLMKNHPPMTNKQKKSSALELIRRSHSTPSTSYCGRSSLGKKIEALPQTSTSDILGDILGDQSVLLSKGSDISITENRKIVKTNSENKELSEDYSLEENIMAKPLPSKNAIRCKSDNSEATEVQADKSLSKSESGKRKSRSRSRSPDRKRSYGYEEASKKNYEQSSKVRWQQESNERKSEVTPKEYYHNVDYHSSFKRYSPSHSDKRKKDTSDYRKRDANNHHKNYSTQDYRRKESSSDHRRKDSLSNYQRKDSSNYHRRNSNDYYRKDSSSDYDYHKKGFADDYDQHRRDSLSDYQRKDQAGAHRRRDSSSDHDQRRDSFSDSRDHHRRDSSKRQRRDSSNDHHRREPSSNYSRKESSSNHYKERERYPYKDEPGGKAHREHQRGSEWQLKDDFQGRRSRSRSKERNLSHSRHTSDSKYKEKDYRHSARRKDHSDSSESSRNSDIRKDFYSSARSNSHLHESEILKQGSDHQSISSLCQKNTMVTNQDASGTLNQDSWHDSFTKDPGKLVKDSTNWNETLFNFNPKLDEDSFDSSSIPGAPPPEQARKEEPIVEELDIKTKIDRLFGDYLSAIKPLKENRISFLDSDFHAEFQTGGNPIKNDSCSDPYDKPLLNLVPSSNLLPDVRKSEESPFAKQSTKKQDTKSMSKGEPCASFLSGTKPPPESSKKSEHSSKMKLLFGDDYSESSAEEVSQSAATDQVSSHYFPILSDGDSSSSAKVEEKLEPKKSPEAFVEPTAHHDQLHPSRKRRLAHREGDSKKGNALSAYVDTCGKRKLEITPREDSVSGPDHGPISGRRNPLFYGERADALNDTYRSLDPHNKEFESRTLKGSLLSKPKLISKEMGARAPASLDAREKEKSRESQKEKKRHRSHSSDSLSGGEGESTLDFGNKKSSKRVPSTPDEPSSESCFANSTSKLEGTSSRMTSLFGDPEESYLPKKSSKKGKANNINDSELVSNSKPEFYNRPKTQNTPKRSPPTLKNKSSDSPDSEKELSDVEIMNLSLNESISKILSKDACSAIPISDKASPPHQKHGIGEEAVAKQTPNKGRHQSRPAQASVESPRNKEAESTTKRTNDGEKGQGPTTPPMDDGMTKIRASTRQELEVKVVEESKKWLDPYYQDKSISKETYKEIISKCVTKVLGAEASLVVEPRKIKKLVYGYVKVYQHRVKKILGSSSTLL